MDAASSNAGVALFFFLAVGTIALFTFLSLATWAGSRQAEREAYYRAELLKKIAEIGGDSNPALDYMREKERISAAKRLGGMKLGGLVNIAVGLGLFVLLGTLTHWARVYAIGVLPLFIGFALLLYAFQFAPERHK
jgi:hypothetical protein